MNFSADVELIFNEDNDLTAAEVTVNGHNLSEELVTMLAKHAAAVELGTDVEDLDRSRIVDWDLIEEGADKNVMVLRFG